MKSDEKRCGITKYIILANLTQVGIFFLKNYFTIEVNQMSNASIKFKLSSKLNQDCRFLWF